MLELVDVTSRSIEAYRGIAPDDILDAAITAARALRGARVLHVNATPYGGGVSELLRSTLPILSGLGLVAHWRIVRGDERFFRVTKKIHNGLQGGSDTLTEVEREAYLGASQRNAELLEEKYDFVFLHDPQPAAIRLLRPDASDARWVWRCHIDTSAPNADVWAFVRGYLAGFDAAVFTMSEFVPPDLPVERVEIMPPASCSARRPRSFSGFRPWRLRAPCRARRPTRSSGCTNELAIYDASLGSYERPQPGNQRIANMIMRT